MIRLLLLLLGAKLVQRRWRVLLGIGILWAGLGVAIVIDAFDGSTRVRPHYFGYLLLLEGIVSLFAALLAAKLQPYQFAKALVLIVPALVIIAQPRHSNLLIAMLLGGVLLIDGVARIASAWVVRFDGWRMAIGAGIVEVVLAATTLEPWPTWYEGTIGFNIGALLIVSGWTTMRLANWLRKLPPDAPISALMGGALPAALWHEQTADQAGADVLVVHVWTPTGGNRRARRRPLVDRYIAAVDASGTVSTGHAALELAPALYVSHYPAVEIDRAPDEFGRVLRAGAENDLPGRFLPSYAEEAAGWCEATEHVRFTQIDRAHVRQFWRTYQADTTYNLTSRNCSTAVARALDAALEGVLGQNGRPWRALLHAVVTPELWVAGVLRRRAEAMAWTPGLVLDYARLLQVVVEPAPARASPTWSRLRRLRLRRVALARRSET
ncbi:MAG: putative rane-bound protease [Tardiphaga sp.]|nr:putative rane-bound protease [Tardiphaga sp.]